MSGAAKSLRLDIEEATEALARCEASAEDMALSAKGVDARRLLEVMTQLAEAVAHAHSAVGYLSLLERRETAARREG